MSRIRYLDNLRAAATLLLVPYHSARIYDWPPYYIKSGSFPAFEVFARFIDVWFMPLFFLIAGMAARASLEIRGSRAFVHERLARLVPPFTVGLLLLMPVNGYFAYRHHLGLRLDFIEYLPRFLELASLDGFQGTFAIGHLWFLVYLLVFSLLAPGARALAQRNLASSPAALSATTPALFLALAALLCLARASGLPYPNPLYFAVFFLTGLLQRERQILAPEMRQFAVPLALFGLATMTAVICLRLATAGAVSGTFWYESLRAVNALVWVTGMLAIGKRLLPASIGWLERVNARGIWIYVVHLPVISAIGYAFVLLPASPWLNWTAIVVTAFAITLLISTVSLQTGKFIRRTKSGR